MTTFIIEEDVKQKELIKLEDFDPRKARLEFSKVLSSLEMFSPLFYQLVEIGLPEFISANKIIQTACVTFDRQGHYLSFLWAKEFWNKLTFYQRVFIASHECLHVYLSHGSRMRGCKQPQIANLAADIVVNEMLVQQFGFDKDLLGDFKDELIWLDKYFDDDEKYYDKTMEFYYHELIKQIKKLIKEGKISIVSGVGGGLTIYPDDEFDELMGSPIDNHDGLKEFNKEIEEGLAKKVSKKTTDEEKNDFKDLINSDLNHCSQERGTMAGNATAIIKKKKIKYNYKWTDIIRFWRIKNTKPDEYEETWHYPNRRIQELPDSMFLPVEHDGEEEGEGEKIDVWFFMDTSGSCGNMKEEFFDCACSFPQDKFNLRPFCFDTRVYDINLKDGKLYGFGGTCFNIIEYKIQKILKKEGKKYPDAVFVFTDGYGNKVNPQRPERWHWFLTRQNSKSYIPKQSLIYNISDFKP